MKNIIEAVQKHLQQEVKEFRYVDQDWGQLDFWGDKPPVKFPCALLDVQSAEYSNLGELLQQANITLVVRIFDFRLSNSSFKAPANQKENAAKIWKLIEDVNKALHGSYFLPNGYGTPSRTSMRRTKRQEGYYQTDIYYSLAYRDDSCELKYVGVQATPEVEVDLLKR